MGVLRTSQGQDDVSLTYPLGLGRWQPGSQMPLLAVDDVDVAAALGRGTMTCLEGPLKASTPDSAAGGQANLIAKPGRDRGGLTRASRGGRTHDQGPLRTGRGSVDSRTTVPSTWRIAR